MTNFLPNVPPAGQEIVGAVTAFVKRQANQEGPQGFAVLQSELALATAMEKALEDRLEHVLGAFFGEDPVIEVVVRERNQPARIGPPLLRPRFDRRPGDCATRSSNDESLGMGAPCARRGEKRSIASHPSHYKSRRSWCKMLPRFPQPAFAMRRGKKSRPTCQSRGIFRINSLEAHHQQHPLSGKESHVLLLYRLFRQQARSHHRQPPKWSRNPSNQKRQGYRFADA